MTWASHIIVGASVAKVFGLNIPLVSLGAVLPDLAEMVSRRVEHRGVTHSFALWTAALALAFMSNISFVRDTLIGVVFGHLLMDSLTVMGVPILDERSRKLTLFGGKLRTASAGEFIVSGLIAFIAFVIFSSVSIDTERRNWKSLYETQVIDKREYYDNRFRFF